MIHPFKTLIMIAEGKNGEKNHLLNFDNFFLRNRGCLRNIFLIFLVISQELFDLQRRTIPHFNPLKELITPKIIVSVILVLIGIFLAKKSND